MAQRGLEHLQDPGPVGPSGPNAPYVVDLPFRWGDSSYAPGEVQVWREAGRESEYFALATLDVARMLAYGVLDGTGLSADEVSEHMLSSWGQMQGYLEAVSTSGSRWRVREGDNE